MGTTYRINPLEVFSSVSFRPDVPEETNEKGKVTAKAVPGFTLPESIRSVPLIVRGDLGAGSGEILDRIRSVQKTGHPAMFLIQGKKSEGALGAFLILPMSAIVIPNRERRVF